MIKKMITKAIGVTVILVLFFLTLIPLYNFDNVNYKYKIGEDNKLDIINLGSSHGNSFLYNEFNVNGKRLNTAGNTIYYDLQVYKLVNEGLSENAVVVIPLSYYYFGVDENRTDRKDNGSFVNQYYHILPPESIFNYTVQKHFDLISDELKNNIPKVVFGERNSREPMVLKKPAVVKLFSNIDKVKKSNYDFKKKGLARANRHSGMCKEENISKNNRYLNELIEEIKKNNHIPIVVIPPMHYLYDKNFSKQWKEKFLYNNIESIVEKNKIVFFDYSNDSRFSNRSDLFLNSDHLNKTGSLYFSYNFYKDLNKIKNLDLKKIDLSFLDKKTKSKKNGLKKMGFDKLEVKEDIKTKSFIFIFDEKIKNFQNYFLSIKFLDKSNKLLFAKNILNVKENLKNNSLTKKISKKELFNVEKISINFFEKNDNEKAVKKSETVKINLKEFE